MGLSRRALLSLRLPTAENPGPPRTPRPFPAAGGAPGLVAALAPLAETLREVAGDGALDVPVGEHTVLDRLPHGDESAAAVTSVLGVALTPRPRRAGRELLRVLRPGGLLVLAVPTPSTLVARTLKMAALPGPSPLLWGDEETAAKRLPGAEVETRPVAVTLGFESLQAAWETVGEPFGLPASRFDRFADMVLAHVAGGEGLRMQDRWRIVLARKAG